MSRCQPKLHTGQSGLHENHNAHSPALALSALACTPYTDISGGSYTQVERTVLPASPEVLVVHPEYHTLCHCACKPCLPLKTLCHQHVPMSTPQTPLTLPICPLHASPPKTRRRNDLRLRLCLQPCQRRVAPPPPRQLRQLHASSVNASVSHSRSRISI